MSRRNGISACRRLGVHPPLEGEGRERSERGGVNFLYKITPPRRLRSLRSLGHSRCFASAFLALRTAAEGRLCLPLQGRVKETELAAGSDSISSGPALLRSLDAGV